MGYPREVSREFCHKHQVWRAFDGVKIVAFDADKDVLEDICPHGSTIKKSDTRVPSTRKGLWNDGCKLHYGAEIERGKDHHDA